MFFIKAPNVYKSFGFGNEYPMVAAIFIFTIGLAPSMAALLDLFLNWAERKNVLIAGKDVN